MKQKLNILYHHRTQGRGAEGVHITSIVNALESMGHNVNIVSPPGVDPLSNAGNAPVDKSEVKTKGVNSIWKFISKYFPNFLFEIVEVLYNIPASYRLEKELSSTHYDILYERYAFYMIAGAIKAKKYGIPFILEANEVNGINNRARTQSFPNLCNIFERYLFKRCKSIHTVSSYLKNMIINQGVQEENILVVPNAINPNKFCGDIDSTHLCTEFNLKDKIVLGFAGWFDEWDRLDLLVDVFYKLLHKHKNIVLLLVGDGAVLDIVRKKISTLKIEENVILTGAVERAKIQEYLSLLDMAIFTHSNEFGSPVVMFEFMGLKIPIIAPTLLPITDVLVHNENALLFKPLDMDELQFNIDILLSDKKLRNKLSDSAYSKLMTQHTWNNNAENIINTSGVIS